MRVGIISYIKRHNLSDDWNSPNEELLLKAAKNLGHQCRVLQIEKIQYGNDLLYDGQKFPHFDFIIPRLNTDRKNLYLETTILRYLESCKIPMLNSIDSILKAKNKIETYAILSQQALPLAKTMIVNHQNYLPVAVKIIGSFPIIVKGPIGSWGLEVALAKDMQELISIYKSFCNDYQSEQILLQEFLDDKPGLDHRGFVLGGKVIAAMERQAKSGEFRSNLYQGGEARSIDLSAEEETLCLKAVAALGLDLAAVDLLYSNEKGWLINEVNATPGLEGITKATGLDIAGEIIQFICENY